MARYWKHQTLKQLKKSVGHIDLTVTGASAITPSGIRFGKGHDYFDVEVREFDTAIDYIVTPTRVIKTRNEFPKPTRGILWSQSTPRMREQIPPIQELWRELHCK